MTVSLEWTCSWPAPKKPGKRPREWVPETHSLTVRNWNSRGLGLLANRVDGGEQRGDVDTVEVLLEL